MGGPRGIAAIARIRRRGIDLRMALPMLLVGVVAAASDRPQTAAGSKPHIISILQDGKNH